MLDISIKNKQVSSIKDQWIIDGLKMDNVLYDNGLRALYYTILI
jgi:hypothetical protein